MYAYIKGKLIEVTNTSAVIDNNGIGYYVNIPNGPGGNIPQIGEEVVCYTHYVLSENGITIYGFFTAKDRDLFVKMRSLKGVKSNQAMALIADLGYANIISAILNEDEKALSRAKGVGGKVSKYLILELKGAFDTEIISDAIGTQITQTTYTQAKTEAIEALCALGYPIDKSRAAVNAVEGGDDMSVEELLSSALREM